MESFVPMTDKFTGQEIYIPITKSFPKETNVSSGKQGEGAPSKFKNFLRNFQWFDNSQHEGPGFLSGLGATMMAVGAPDTKTAADILKQHVDRFSPDLDTKLKFAEFIRKISEDESQAGVRDLNKKIMEKQLELLGSGQIQSSNISGLETPLGGATNYPNSDYLIKQKVVNVRGIPTIQNIPELKPALPSSEARAFQGILNTELILNQNLAMLEKDKSLEKYMSPFEPKAWKGGNPIGAWGNLLIKINPKDKNWGAFKAETDKAFQTFRKETTGAQAALAELGWLAPDYPEADDNPALYKQKAAVAIRRIGEAKELLKQLWGPNYRLSGLDASANPENNDSKLKELGLDPSRYELIKSNTVK
jgi:hypothetical protein